MDESDSLIGKVVALSRWIEINSFSRCKGIDTITPAAEHLRLDQVRKIKPVVKLAMQFFQMASPSWLVEGPGWGTDAVCDSPQAQA